MNAIRISDTTLCEVKEKGAVTFTFKEKVETARLLDRLCISVIELPALSGQKIDEILVKTIAPILNNSILSLAVTLGKGNADISWQTLKEARKPRLRVSVPVSAACMEYECHKKPAALIEAVTTTLAECRALCNDVEFVARDSMRADRKLLIAVVTAAIEAGATTVTFCCGTGNTLPSEFTAFIDELKAEIPSLSTVKIGASCSDMLGTGVACMVSAIEHGINEVKVTSGTGKNQPKCEALIRLAAQRDSNFSINCGVKTTELEHVMRFIRKITAGDRAVSDTGVKSLTDNESKYVLRADDTLETVSAEVKKLGYELSSEDCIKVYDAFKRLSEKKNIGTKELEAIVATVALQVAPTYKLVSYLTTSGNISSSMAQITLERDGKEYYGISSGDGPIDAAFRAIEQILGHHYELDDFQIQSVTEGREAMGSAIIKIRSDGKLYSGQGISTDIIGASINSYINALNKIIYEEA